MFDFTIGNYGFEWNGSRTVNVFAPLLGNIDVFSLDYSTEYNTRLDAMAAALDWIDTNA